MLLRKVYLIEHGLHDESFMNVAFKSHIKNLAKKELNLFLNAGPRI